MNPIQLHTDRLLLKAVTPALIHELMETKTQEEVCAWFGVEEDGYRNLLSMHEQGMETHRISKYYFLLVEKESNRIIGECGFHTWNKTHRRAEVFYSLRNDTDKRKGLMTEALDVVLRFGFTGLNLHRIQGLIAASNTPSLKLLQRYGFTREGTMREDYQVDGKPEDSECYSLLRWEWEQNNPE